MKRLVAIASMTLLVAGCGRSAASRPRLEAAPSGAQLAAAQPAFQATVRTAQCKDWGRADEADQRKLVDGMAAFFSTETDQPGAYGNALSQERALALFNGYCAQPYAEGFSLYRLYSHAAGFTRKG